MASASCRRDAADLRRAPEACCGSCRCRPAGFRDAAASIAAPSWRDRSATPIADCPPDRRGQAWGAACRWLGATSCFCSAARERDLHRRDLTATKSRLTFERHNVITRETNSIRARGKTGEIHLAGGVGVAGSLHRARDFDVNVLDRAPVRIVDGDGDSAARRLRRCRSARSRRWCGRRRSGPGGRSAAGAPVVLGGVGAGAV